MLETAEVISQEQVFWKLGEAQVEFLDMNPCTDVNDASAKQMQVSLNSMNVKSHEREGHTSASKDFNINHLLKWFEI